MGGHKKGEELDVLLLHCFSIGACYAPFPGGSGWHSRTTELCEGVSFLFNVDTPSGKDDCLHGHCPQRQPFPGGGGDLARHRRAGDSCYHVVRARRPPPLPLFCLVCQALVLFSMVRPGRGRGRAGGRACGQQAPHPQHPIRRQHWFTTAVMRRWRTAVVAAFPHTQHRRNWVREVCLLRPVDRVAPGAVRMQDLLAGCWDGLRHAPGAELLLDNADLWMSAVPVPGGVPDLGVKGAPLCAVFGWRYPPGATLCARAPRPTTYQQNRPLYRDRWVAPHLGAAAHHPVSGGWGVAAGATGLGCQPPPANCFV